MCTADFVNTHTSQFPGISQAVSILILIFSISGYEFHVFPRLVFAGLVVAVNCLNILKPSLTYICGITCIKMINVCDISIPKNELDFPMKYCDIHEILSIRLIRILCGAQ